jgi:hypothetical protein
MTIPSKFRVLAFGFTLCTLRGVVPVAAEPVAATTQPTKAIPDEMEVQIKGQFKGRFLVKKIVAPVTMNLEKLQDFPEDPSQKILLDPLPISQSAEFNARSEVKGHAPFYPWIPALPEPPFLRMTPPKLDKDHLPASWMFEVFNPQGQTIFRQRGTNALPDELIWEGKDSEKKFAVVDRLYSAQLTLTSQDEKATIISGDSVILPAMVYGSAESETIELSLTRLFDNGKATISAEGTLMLVKISERLRERGLTKMHVRVSGNQQDLSYQREVSLVEALQKALHLSPGLIEHDHTPPTLRGEVASFWLKMGNAQ